MTSDSPLTDRISIPAPFSLGERLDGLLAIIQRHQPKLRYTHIWDCCCDHGYLGMKILQTDTCERVTFVDCVTSITARVSGILSQHMAYVDKRRYQVYTADAAELELDASDNNLIILAGIGGLLASRIIAALIDRYPHLRMDFLCCPATTQYDLREFLHSHDFDLLWEQPLYERGRLYEALLVSRGQPDSTTVRRVSLTGSCWDGSNSSHITYLKKLQRHYQQQMRGAEAERAATVATLYTNTLNAIKLTPQS